MSLIKSFLITLIFLFSLSNIIFGSVGKDTTAVGTITSFYIYDAIIDSLEIGPSVDSISVPENGIGYIYYFFKLDSIDVIPIYFADEFQIPLQYNYTQEFNCNAIFLEEGILRIAIPSDPFGIETSIEFTIPDTIKIDRNLYILNENSFSFIATKIPTKYTRTWNLFAAGSAGISGTIGSIGAGASVSAVKASIKGEGGVGFQIQTNENGTLFLDRRMEFGMGWGVEVPSINLVVGKVQIGVNGGPMIKTLVGQLFCFSDLSIDESKKKMAKTGFILETMSIGGMGIAPTTGPIIKAVVSTLNSLGGVSSTFDEALLSSYWGVGIEGSLSAGLEITTGMINAKAIKHEIAFVTNFKFTTHERVMSKIYQNFHNRVMSVGTSIDISLAINYSSGLLSFGLPYSDGVDLSFGKPFLFDESLGGEVAFGVKLNSSNSVENLSINLKGGGDITSLFGTSRSIYYNTAIEIPGKYSQLIKDAGRGLSGLYFTGVSVPLGLDMINDAVASVKDTYNSLSETPIKISTNETRGKGQELKLSVDLDAAFGVGVGLSLGVNAKYLDEIEFPKKHTEIYLEGKNYLISSADYTDNMVSEEFSTIARDLFSGTIPLIKEALSNIINVIKETIAAGKEFIIKTGEAVIGKISGVLQSAGSWTVSWFSPNSSMVLGKQFETPIVKQMYYSTNVKKKRTVSKDNYILEDEETILIIVSESMNVSFTLDGGNETVDSVDTPINVEMTINEEILIANGFTVEDKDRIKIYRYDYKLLSWVLEGGIRNNDTLKTTTDKLGTFSLGIELTTEIDDTPPEIYETGPQQGSILNDYMEIYGKIRDDRYGTGINLAESHIILNGDTLNISYDPTNEKIYYSLSELDSLSNGTMNVTIIASDLNGNVAQESFSFELNITSVEDKNIPNKFKLNQNYPNPFNPTTTIQFEIPVDANVSINIYDIKGSFVTTVYSGRLNTGVHNVQWNATNSRGQKVSSGIYFYQLKTDNFNVVKKMQLLK